MTESYPRRGKYVPLTERWPPLSYKLLLMALLVYLIIGDFTGI